MSESNKPQEGNVVAFAGQQRELKKPDFVDMSVQVKLEDVPSIIAENKTAYAGLLPLKLILDVEGNGKHILYRVDAEAKRFGLVTIDQLTTEPVIYAAFQVDGQELPLQVFNIREMSNASPEELAAIAGVLKVTKQGEGVSVEQVYMNNGGQK